ncbi:MAG: hypothetical protein EPO68_17585 [Planctomycetota bacterium]|nr:MAG: hypothetical protein EPO68_17585 [Planctomycetota bacterium]
MKLVFAMRVTLLVVAVSGAARAAQVETRAAPPTAPARAVPTYDLTLRLLPSAHRLEASGIVVVPPSNAERAVLAFGLRAEMRAPRVTVLAPSASAGEATLRDVGPDNGPDGRRRASTRWELVPARAFTANEPIALQFDYAGGEDAIDDGYFRVATDGSFAATNGSAWIPVFDGDEGLGTLRFVVPRGEVVVASGALVERTDAGDESTFVFRLAEPSIVGFAAGAYTVVRRREGRIPLSVYLFSQHPRVEGLLDVLARSLGVLEREFGPFAFRELALVESSPDAARSEGFDGMALPGFFLLQGDALRHEPLDVVPIAHELAHQWFPYLARGAGGATPLVLDEGLAHYGALRVVEELDPTGAIAARRRGLRRALRMIAAGYDSPLGALPNKASSYSLSVFKGAHVYDMLSRHVGREAFRGALRRIATEHARGSFTLPDLLAAVERAAGRELDEFYAAWFGRAGCPTLALSWQQGERKLECTITQSSLPYRLDVPIQIALADGTLLLRRMQVESVTTSLELEVPQPVAAVALDPELELFHATPEQWQEARDLAWLTRGEFLRDTGRTDLAIERMLEGLSHLPEVDANGVEFRLRAGVGELHERAGRLEEAALAYERALGLSVRPKQHVGHAQLGLARVASDLGDRKRAIEAARAALASELENGELTLTTDRALALLARLGADESSD